jgi:hypothetical protein
MPRRRSLSHGHAEIGGGQRDRVIDPVADHRDRSVAPQCGNRPGLVGRQCLGADALASRTSAITAADASK